MKTVVFVSVLLIAGRAFAGGVNAATEVPYPTQWSQPQIGPGGVVVPPVPTRFTTRSVGTTFQPAPNGVRVLPQDVVPEPAGPGLVLIEGAGKGDLKAVKALLDKGANVNATNPRGETALMRASAGGYVEVAQLLLDKGAEVNEVTKLGQTALILAVQSGHAKVVELLLARKADRKVMDEVGRMAIDYATAAKRPDLIALLTSKKSD